MKWPSAELGQVAVLDRDSVHPSDASPGTPYVGLEHVDGDGGIQWSKTVESAELKSNKFRFTNDHVLFGKLRPYLRKIARPEASGICSTDIIPLMPGEQLDRDYLFHFLRTPAMVELATSRCSGANLPRLSPKQLASFAVPLPPLAEQKRIAGILDAADALRAKRRESLAQLDTLIQATFLDMFGDPKCNPYGYEKRRLADFYIDEKTGTRCGPFGSALKKSEYRDSGVPVWNMDNIGAAGRVQMPFRMWIGEEKFQQLRAFEVRAGDVLVSRAGTVGKMCVAPAETPSSLISTNLIRVRFGAALIPEYFVALMTFCKGRVGRLRTGPDGAFTHMNTTVLDSLEFPYPPIERQTEFKEFLTATEQHRAKSGKHSASLDELFIAVQARAFAGEL